MLTDEQLETLADAVEALDVAYPSDKAAAAAAIADMNAMRTPITAEALVQAGNWTHESTGLYRHDKVNAGDEVISVRLFVDFCDDGHPKVYIGDLTAQNVTNMHDLAELVRLLGGAK